jgi:hypothetical protein
LPGIVSVARLCLQRDRACQLNPCHSIGHILSGVLIRPECGTRCCGIEASRLSGN